MSGKSARDAPSLSRLPLQTVPEEVVGRAGRWYRRDAASPPLAHCSPVGAGTGGGSTSRRKRDNFSVGRPGCREATSWTPTNVPRQPVANANAVAGVRHWNSLRTWINGATSRP
eukprot:scaffold2417_cov174-Isochrysis_galbana.AAC.6